MRAHDYVLSGRKLLSLAMIFVGILCAVAEFTRGSVSHAYFGKAYAAQTPAGVEIPRIENGKLETRTVEGSLEVAFRAIAS